MSKLDTYELAALVTYAARHGRRWKADLRRSWYDGQWWQDDEVGILQTLRNSERFGPRGLVNFRLPKATV